MGKDKRGKTASECTTCGTHRTCQVCQGGRWHTKNVECTHCEGTGICPIND